MAKSRQPRFDPTADPNSVFSTIMKAFELGEPEPAYEVNSSKRDIWLRSFLNKEPHLSGIVSSVAAIDKNRGWSLVGGRNQVKHISQMFHDFQVAPGLKGWRPACAFLSSSFWGSNMGAVTEIGRDGGPDGIAVQLYTVDPTKCGLTGSNATPLKYNLGGNKRNTYWRPEDFFRVSGLQSTDQALNGLGFCSVDRAVQLAQLMLALYRHDEEMLLSKAPRGLLLLSGIKQAQWKTAMQASDAEEDASMMEYFGAMAVLASASTPVEAKVVALSQLPAGFDLKTWTDMIMYGYSLCFGYDPSEFYPVQYGALGRGNEVQLQHEKATGKGRLEFVLGFQEQVQDCLPSSIDFLFEQRDDQGDLLKASVDQAWVNVVKTMYTSQLNGIPLITNEEARVILADHGVIPTTWSATAEPAATDQEDSDDDPALQTPDEKAAEDNAASNNGGTSNPKSSDPNATNPDSAKPTAQYFKPSFKTAKINSIREQYIVKQTVREAARKFPNDPIVMYTYPGNSEIELWPSGEDLLKQRVW